MSLRGFNTMLTVFWKIPEPKANRPNLEVFPEPFLCESVVFSFNVSSWCYIKFFTTHIIITKTKYNNGIKNNNIDMNIIKTWLVDRLKSGSEALRLCIILRLPSTWLICSIDGDVTNDDIAIVDWLVKNLRPFCGCWWLFCMVLLDIDVTGGGVPPTTRCAVLSKRLSNFPTILPGAKFVENPPYK